MLIDTALNDELYIAPMNANRKRTAALARLAMTGIWRSNYEPPLVRFLWWLGIDVPPPHFGNFWGNALGLGSCFAVATGISNWFLLWSRTGRSPLDAAISACVSGAFFGLSMAVYYDHGRRKYGLPLWCKWNLPTANPAVQLSDYEKERGKPLPSFNHGLVQGKLIGALGSSTDYSMFSELTLELPDGHHSTPDLSVYPKMRTDWNHDIIRMTVMPIFVVEILTMGQPVQDALDKIALYFADGVKSAWLVQPDMQSITIYLPGNSRPQVFTTGEAKDPVTGLTARLEEIFA